MKVIIHIASLHNVFTKNRNLFLYSGLSESQELLSVHDQSSQDCPPNCNALMGEHDGFVGKAVSNFLSSASCEPRIIVCA